MKRWLPFSSSYFKFLGFEVWHEVLPQSYTPRFQHDRTTPGNHHFLLFGCVLVVISHERTSLDFYSRYKKPLRLVHSSSR